MKRSDYQTEYKTDLPVMVTPLPKTGGGFRFTLKPRRANHSVAGLGESDYWFVAAGNGECVGNRAWRGIVAAERTVGSCGKSGVYPQTNAVVGDFAAMCEAYAAAMDESVCDSDHGYGTGVDCGCIRSDDTDRAGTIG